MSQEVGEFWALVELLGRQRVTGRCRWIMQGQTCVLLQVDVPSPDPEKFAYTEFYGPGAIFRLTLRSEEQARKTFRPSPPDAPNPDHETHEDYDDDGYPF